MKRLLYILFFLVLTSCDSKTEPSITFFSGDAMTMHYRIMIGNQLSKKEKMEVDYLIQETFSLIDKTFNRYNENSELSKLNSLTEEKEVSLSPLMSELLDFTDTMVSVTEGKFDPTVYPLQKLWVDHLSQGKIPPEELAEHIKQNVGWSLVTLNGGSFKKKRSDVQLDLGGIAKGFCIDLIVKKLHGKGYPHLYVEWGGEIRATGKHPEDRDWTIYISRLDDINPNEAVAFLALKDQAVATSGDYLQNWTVGEDCYCHIVDPNQKEPLKIKERGIASASVVAPTCTLADALATAAMLFPSAKEAKEWAERVQILYPETDFWILSHE